MYSTTDLDITISLFRLLLCSFIPIVRQIFEAKNSENHNDRDNVKHSSKNTNDMCENFSPAYSFIIHMDVISDEDDNGGSRQCCSKRW